MKTSARPQSKSEPQHSRVESLRRIIRPEDIDSAERALRQLARLAEPDRERSRSLLELAASVRPVSHWGLNE